MEQCSNRILTIITGATGFVGQNIIKYFQPIGIDTKTLSLRDLNWKEYFNTVQADAIIHLAGKAHDTTNTSSPEDYFKVNRDLTIALFDQFLKSETRDFFYFSSVKAVADTVDGELLEDVIGKPMTPYGHSKLQAEQYLLAQKLPAGKRLFIIRPCMVHGPGNKGNLNLLYQVVKKGIPWPLASFYNQRSFLAIDNLTFLIEKMLLNLNVPSGIYNFADDEPLSTNDLVTIIANSLHKSPRLLYISPRLIKSIVRIGDVIPMLLNSERLKKLTESYVVSNDKIKNILGIDRLPVTAFDGLRKTIKSFSNTDR
jgi:nucleoside-diphosphate-sugar epimerase